jgi:hypothetical protein
MPSQTLYELMNYGSMVLIVAVVVVGIVLTRAAIRTLLAAALVVTVVRFLLSTIFPGWLDVANEGTAFAYSFVQTVLVVGEAFLFVAAAVAGARTIRAKDAAIAALVDKATPTWQQPKHSPDPTLLSD